MIRSRRTLGLLLALVVGVSGPVALASTAEAAYQPPNGAVFNNPRGGFDARWRIVKAVDQAVKHARKGSLIQFSTFLMDSRASADALIAARRRGVKVQLVMDGDDARTGQSKRIARVLNRDNRPRRDGVDEDGIPLKWGKDKSFVVFCKGSCRGKGGNLHAKFYLFSKTGAAHDVVMVSSSNLNAGGATKGWNDLYSMPGREVMFKQFSAIHAEMAQDTSQDRDGYRQLRAGNIVSRFYPKVTAGDPVMGDLKKIRCQGVSGGAGRDGHTAVNIAMFAWNNTRGMNIARKIVSLDRAGCNVSIVYGAPSAQVRDYLAGSARNGGVKLWDSRVDRDGDGYFDLRTHLKYMLINGVYGPDHSSWRVHTGSQNWGRGTLHRGDDDTINVPSRRAYGQYIRNWDSVVAVSRRIGLPAKTKKAAARQTREMRALGYSWD